MTGLDVIIAARAEREAIAGMMQLYTHDFSEYWAGTARGDLDAQGRFADYPLDPYWTEPGHIPLLLRLEGRLIGFALLNAETHSGLPVERNMAEFFIARKYRRGGLGTDAARLIFSRYPGQWEAAVARANVGALDFWRNAARGHPGIVGEVEEAEVASEAWNGPILRFRIGP